MSDTTPPVFRPFADAAAVRTIGGLCLENGRDRIAVHGSLDLTRDRMGLQRARALQAAITAIVDALADQAPSEAVAEAAKPATTVRNPFA